MYDPDATGLSYGRTTNQDASIPIETHVTTADGAKAFGVALGAAMAPGMVADLGWKGAGMTLAKGAAGSYFGGAAGTYGSRALGATEDEQQFFGDVGSLVGGAVGGYPRTKGVAPKMEHPYVEGMWSKELSSKTPYKINIETPEWMSGSAKGYSMNGDWILTESAAREAYANEYAMPGITEDMFAASHGGRRPMLFEYNPCPPKSSSSVTQKPLEISTGPHPWETGYIDTHPVGSPGPNGTVWGPTGEFHKTWSNGVISGGGEPQYGWVKPSTTFPEGFQLNASTRFQGKGGVRHKGRADVNYPKAIEELFKKNNIEYKADGLKKYANAFRKQPNKYHINNAEELAAMRQLFDFKHGGSLYKKYFI